MRDKDCYSSRGRRNERQGMENNRVVTRRNQPRKFRSRPWNENELNRPQTKCVHRNKSKTPKRKDLMTTAITLSDAKDAAIVLGTVVALITFIKGVIEYRRQGAQKRAEYFRAMREQLTRNQQFRDICELLSKDGEDPKLMEIPKQEKFDFLAVFEEVAFGLESGLISKYLAHYMFGYYAITCWESKSFWKGLDPDGMYWTVFNDFAKKMKKAEDSFCFDMQRFRF